VYYSQRDDFEDPNSYGNYWDFPQSKKHFEKYLEGKAKPQLRELLTGYGPLGLIWFDHGLYTAQQAQQVIDLVRGLQPRCLVNGRVGNYGQELMGDYQNLSNHGLPASGVQEYFEALQTLNDSWGCNKFDDRWKSSRTVIHNLVDAVSKGGNYLLDVGPTAAGRFPQEAVDIFERVGEWLRLNGESIYGTSASPFIELPWGRCTVKGEKLYLHVFDWPHDAVLSLAGLRNDVKKAYLLKDKDRILNLTREGSKLIIGLPNKPPDENDTVTVLEIVGKPEVAPPVVTQDRLSSITLDYDTAVTAGRAIKRFNRLGKYHISKWLDPRDMITWSMKIDKAQRYQVWITYAAQKEWEGGKYQVSVGGTSLKATVVNWGIRTKVTAIPG
jgi:alpha-L-fucosidase